MKLSLQGLQRPLGATGLRVSPLGLGTVKLGRDQGVKYPQAFAIPDDQTAARLLDLAQDLGINLLDTAPAYGNSEARLGKLLRGQRQRWILASKVGEEFEHGQSHFDFSPQHTRQSVERSLRRLATDCIDLVLVHSDGRDLDVLNNSGVYQTLEQLKQDGKIRAFGFSGKTLEGGLLALDKGDCAMITYNPGYLQERPVIELAQTRNKGILIKKALNSGHACLTPGVDPVQASFELIFAHPGVSSAIVGTIDPRHLAHNVQVAATILTQPTPTRNAPGAPDP